MTTVGRPNILLIHADQHRYDCVAHNGHPFVKTPHLDRLASEGMGFSHAFSPSPVCVPARASLLSGQFATGHLSIANDGTEAPRPLRDDIPLFPPLLKDAGYYMGYVGKWAVDAQRDPTHYGFHHFTAEHAYDVWRRSQGLPPRPQKNGYFGETDPHIDPEASRLMWGANETIQLLSQCAENPQRPFFIRWDPSEPHLPNVVPEPFASMYPPERIPPWPNFDDPLQGKPYIQAQQRRSWQVDQWTWDDWAPIVGRYLGEVSLLDAAVGRILHALSTLNLHANTLVIYTCDHGDMCGSHGMIDKHYVMYDEITRVPLIMRWPRVIPAGRTCAAFVSSAVDLAATICDVADLTIPSTFQGMSLLPFMQGTANPAHQREDIFATYHGAQMGLYSQRMVRNKAWKYVWNATAEDELYDLIADPGEVQNRIGDEAAAPVLAQLRRRLVAWMEQTSDPLLNGRNVHQLLHGGKP